MAQYIIRFPRFGTVTLLSMWQKGKRGKNFRFLVEKEEREKRRQMYLRLKKEFED